MTSGYSLFIDHVWILAVYVNNGWIWFLPKIHKNASVDYWEILTFRLTTVDHWFTIGWLSFSQCQAWFSLEDYGWKLLTSGFWWFYFGWPFVQYCFRYVYHGWLLVDHGWILVDFWQTMVDYILLLAAYGWLLNMGWLLVEWWFPFDYRLIAVDLWMLVDYGWLPIISWLMFLLCETWLTIDITY